MILGWIKGLVARSAIFRFLLLPLAFVIFSLAITSLIVLAHRKPAIESVNPSIGVPGDVIVIRGNHFGKERGDSWIEISGDRLTAKSYLGWNETMIMATVPQTVRDGLVLVHTLTGKSNPLIFANKENIPIAARTKEAPGMPLIESFNTEKVETGKLLIINGKNFGITRNESQVIFGWQTDPAIPQAAPGQSGPAGIACSDHDFDYEFWSDQELRVRVPDGAASGNVYVKTERGTSEGRPVELANQPGTKTYVNQKTFVLSMEVDITNISAGDGNLLHLRIPVPISTASQRNVEITASNPKPYLENYQGIILHQLENLKSGKNEQITHSFLLTNHEIQTNITPAKVKPYSETDSPMYTLYTTADRIIPSGDQNMIVLAAQITGKEKNPWLKAELLYRWITQNIVQSAVTNPDRTLAEMVSTHSGDAYDEALLFCTLARASGIPSIPVAGILVDADRNSRVHWWAEFYIENFGWVPADPSLGKDNLWYFGNLDVNHIAFSRGWSDQKPMTPNSKVVYRPRSFALQPVWEEAAGNIRSYTSFWSEPKVTGIY